MPRARCRLHEGANKDPSSNDGTSPPASIRSRSLVQLDLADAPVELAESRAHHESTAAQDGEEREYVERHPARGVSVAARLLLRLEEYLLRLDRVAWGLRAQLSDGDW